MNIVGDVNEDVPSAASNESQSEKYRERENKEQKDQNGRFDAHGILTMQLVDLI